MHNLVLLFLRFGHLIIFFFLEIFCLYLIVIYNQKQKAIWDNSNNIFMGYSSEKWNDWTNYFSLDKKNDALAAENTRLKEQLINVGLTPNVKKDTTDRLSLEYELLLAKVIRNSTHKPNNYVYIDKGSEDGVKKDMGIISRNGIVGIINKVNKNRAVANSLLHRRSFISAMIKRTGAYGSLRWIDSDPRYVNLVAIENHHTVNVGDTIVTSGYSTHFPPNIEIGIVKETNLPPGSTFHEIKVALSNDFSALQYVQVVVNRKKEQQIALEKEVSDE